MGKGSYILGKVLGCRVIPNILGKGFNIMGNGPRIMGNGSNILGTIGPHVDIVEFLGEIDISPENKGFRQ